VKETMFKRMCLALFHFAVLILAVRLRMPLLNDVRTPGNNQTQCFELRVCFA
jgi:hypothetical protein